MPPHIFYAVSHDLRADLDTPNLRAMAAADGCISFSHAFCQAPYCTPSRASFFTGRRPSVTDIHTFEQNVEKDAGLSGAARRDTEWRYDELLHLNWFDELQKHAAALGHRRPRHPSVRTAAPRAFRDAGYVTYGAGVTLMGKNRSWQHCEPCWSDGYTKISGWGNMNGLANPRCDGSVAPCADDFESSHDFLVASAAVAWLQAWEQRPAAARPPFFVMVGFWGGHQDYSVEASYYDEYASPAVRLTADSVGWELPAGASALTGPAVWEAQSLPAWQRRSVNVQAWAAWRRGYHAAENKMDAALGLVLTHLDKAGLTASTITVFHVRRPRST